MKRVYFFLLSLICLSCTNKVEQQAMSLNDEVKLVPILSSTLDSLLIEVQTLPPHLKFRIFFDISSRDEIEVSKVKKQEELLVETLTFASRKERKKVLQRLIALYKILDKLRVSDAISEGIKRCKELEQDYSLSQEEQWNVKKSKAFFLNRHGNLEESLMIWQNLLDEHRSVDKTEYIIEDLNTIASYFIKLGDTERGLSIYKDAYQLVLDNNLLEYKAVCLRFIIWHSCYIEHYDEVVNLCNEIGVDSIATFLPSVYSILSTCYLQLQKTDSARLYLNKTRKISKKEIGTVYYCRMAETYIAEKQDDSVSYYLNEAMRQFEVQKKLHKMNLPLYFMPVYAEYGSLLQEKGKMRRAAEAFQLIEPLMNSGITDMPWIEKQIKALAHYGSYLQVTKQYKKAAELLTFRDSIQKKYYLERETIASKNFADRFKIQNLETENKLKQQEINFTLRTSSFSFAICIFLLFIIACLVFALYLMYKRMEKCYRVELEPNLPQPTPPQPAPPLKSEPLSPEEKLYDRAYRMVKSKKLFMDSELTLDKLAKKLASNRSSLSAAINKCAKLNFNQWINKFRLDYVMENISPTVNLSMLYKEAGFNAYNTFNSCFKEHLKCTPTEFLKTDEFKKLQESRSAT